MPIDTRRKVLRITTMALASALLTTSALPQEQPRHSSVVTPAQAPTGEVLAEHISVSFAPLAPEWVAEQNVMDPIWEPLGYKGVNYYAYGGPATGHNFAARSDADSSLYQAWFGAYVIAGGKAAFGMAGENHGCQAFAKLAEYDQRSWLQAMGDPSPLAQSMASPHFSTTAIADSKRTTCSFDMKSHSDLGTADTPLAKHMGMPPSEKWKDRLSPFHDLTLHVVGAWWYDSRRDVSVIVYGASSAFTTKSGAARDNRSALDATLARMMTQVHVMNTARGGQ